MFFVILWLMIFRGFWVWKITCCSRKQVLQCIHVYTSGSSILHPDPQHLHMSANTHRELVATRCTIGESFGSCKVHRDRGPAHPSTIVCVCVCLWLHVAWSLHICAHVWHVVDMHVHRKKTLLDVGAWLDQPLKQRRMRQTEKHSRHPQIWGLWNWV